MVSRALAVAAAALLAVALVAGYARRTVVDSGQFANRATVALRSDSVRALIAERITDQVVLKHQGDLIAARPIIESLTSELVGSRAFTTLFRAAIRDVHRAVFDRDQSSVTLTVADVGTVLAAALEKLRPALAREVEDSGRIDLIKSDIGDATSDAARVADRVRLLAPIAAALALLLAAAAVAVAPDRRAAVVTLGAATAVAGVLLIVGWSLVRSLAVHSVDGADERAAVGGVWDAFLGDLRTAAWILAGSGAVVGAAAASLIQPVELGVPLRRAAAVIATEPRGTAARVLRGVGLAVLGVGVLVERDAVLQLAVTVLGLFLVYAGVTAILRVVYRPRPAGARAPEPRRSNGRLAVTTLVAAALIVAAVATFVGTGGATTAAPVARTCEGHAALCERPLDRVALPATHNSMSVPLPGWYSAEQDHPIADQLRDGIRGFLVDTHYAVRLPSDRLRTEFGSKADLLHQASQDGVSQDAIDAALRIRDRLGFAGKGERGMYLCHTFCELGGTTLSSVLDDLHRFLIANPDEIVVLVNQDYVTPADFVAAVEDADLAGLAYRGPLGGKLPTLRQLIDRGQRLVLLAENKAGAAPWYRLAYESAVQETPYMFGNASLLTDPARQAASCRPNRGVASARLFLLNHWVSTDPAPRPSDAEKVNAYRPLLARAKDCRGIRHRLPNLVAVNFYKRGDVFRVVDTLNGVR